MSLPSHQTLTKDLKFLDTDIERAIWGELKTQCFITKFEKTEALSKIIPDVAKYLIGQDSALNVNKGILIRGNTGTGKTALMMAIKNVTKRIKRKIESELLYKPQYEAHELYNIGFNVTSSEKLNVVYEDKENGGKRSLTRFINFYNDKTPNNLFIDDIGAKEGKAEAQHMGNYLNVVEFIITQRYYGFEQTKGALKTHFTTNLDDDKIKEVFGQRAYSRICGMCNIIELTGKDFRI